jgi:hypothetical protein
MTRASVIFAICRQDGNSGRGAAHANHCHQDLCGERLRLPAARGLLSCADVARIRRTRRQNGTVIIVEGRLSAADMGRLEHACSRELISHTPHLEINLRRVTEIDQTALAVLGCIAARGAVLITTRAPVGLC